MYIYLYIYTHIYAYMFVYTYTNIIVYICVRVHINMFVSAHVISYMHTSICVFNISLFAFIYSHHFQTYPMIIFNALHTYTHTQTHPTQPM